MLPDQNIHVNQCLKFPQKRFLIYAWVWKRNWTRCLNHFGKCKDSLKLFSFLFFFFTTELGNSMCEWGAELCEEDIKEHLWVNDRPAHHTVQQWGEAANNQRTTNNKEFVIWPNCTCVNVRFISDDAENLMNMSHSVWHLCVVFPCCWFIGSSTWSSVGFQWGE